MNTKKLLALLLTVVMLVGIMAACAPKAPEEPTPETDATPEAVSEAFDMAVCLASEPKTIDPALNTAVDGAIMIQHFFEGLKKWVDDGNGNATLADGQATIEDKTVNDDGTVTYTYKLRDGLKWSDGQPLTAKDFEFAWKRAASAELAADYGYMFEQVKGYGTDNKDDLAVKALDDTTLEVTLANSVSYWNELLAFPTFFPVREDVVANEGWATDPSTYVCNGAYTIASWDHNSVITTVKNPDYYDAANVSMEQVKYYLSDNANNDLANFKNGDWQMIDDVPTNEIATLKTEYPDEFFVVGQIGTYYVIWNMNEEILP